jgi:branched-chain amino acid transport system ATP-binding protein
MSAPSLLRLSAISKRFGAIVVANGVDLDVARGEALGIIGPNGAGKTTLFGMITGAVTPDSGRVTLDGADITALSPARRCKLGIARSFQIPQPFGGLNVFENLLVAAEFGRADRHGDLARDCVDILDRCGLADIANRRASTLTLLQRKRLELARALASKPKLLLLDEVAGGLTEEECHSLVALVRSIRESGVTIIWIEHIVHALIAAVDRLVVLHGGALIADGDPRTVIASPRVAEIYMGIPADA